ncbi:anthocyanidin 3-O-glucosyltransferase 2-like [Diospyros lotus]|uniref:anthocyanidin 3-O-glucosyltransferase 2-like n=1 Tax=Diospyros lotus TaxID=55363 RepID=UPI00224FED86|nr:anthocyanidin 3-O-glucosyltransferase 2-like [Diospyros lotus]
MKKVELVFVPAPGVGHVVSTVEIAKLLTARDQRLSITILIIKLPFDSKITSFVELLSDQSCDRIRFLQLPHTDAARELLSRSDGRGNPAEFIHWHKSPVRDVVSEMISSGSDSSTLAGLVVDMFCTPMVEVAKEFAIPAYVFFTSSAGMLGMLFHLQSLHDEHGIDTTEFRPDSDEVLEVPTFAKAFQVKCMPSRLLDKDSGAKMFYGVARTFREVRGIIINTFMELETHAVKALADDASLPEIYAVGPVLNLKTEPDNDDQVKSILGWLDNQPSSSVVFLCFGSMGVFRDEQVLEIAHALERSGHRFLWSLRRPPPPNHRGKFPADYDNPQEVLPEGFLERTAATGKVIGWAPQVAVLSHPAVGAFVSHCGWNSTLESIWCGVPMAAWPLYAEQQLNAFQLVEELGLAVEVKMDYRKESDAVVKAAVIEGAIRRLMDGEKSGEIMREKLAEMKEKSRKAVMEGGTSYNSMARLIDDLVSNTSNGSS